MDDYSNIYVVGDAQLSIGSLYMNSFSTINARHSISIGNSVMFGENVHVYDHNHRFNIKNKNFSSQGYKNKPVVIGNNCWIGSGTVILAGAHIGDNCVIGANCLIDGVIPSNTIVRQNPIYKMEPIKYVEENISSVCIGGENLQKK